MSDILHTIAQALRDDDDFLVTAHGNPDGDAVGSMSAFAHMLTRLGKRVAVYNESDIPEYLGWVDFPCDVFTSLETLPFAPRRIIVLDCGDRHRAGTDIQPTLDATPSIQLDHHIGNDNFADINWVDPKCAAVGEMVALLARHFELSLDGALGESCYLAMMSDTGHFAFGNTTPRVLELVADILRNGLDLEAFTARYESTWTLERMHLWGRLFNAVELAHNGQVAWLALPDALLAETGTTLEDTEGIVNYLRRIKGVKIALTARDAGNGASKISLRTHGHVNVQEVAASFGGGGHRNAAGATLDMPLKEAVQAVLSVLGQRLNDGADGNS